MLIRLSKKQKRNLILVIAISAVTLIIILWSGFFNGQDVGPGPEQVFVKKVITINFDILQNPFLKVLFPFEKISQFEEQKGRTNPFVPY